MKTLRSSQFVIGTLLFSALRALSQPNPSSPSGDQLSVSEIATNYSHYQQITKQAIEVNPELAMLCVGVSKTQINETRKKFGPHANTDILIYMNSLAAAAFSTNTTVFPVGSVVVKKKALGGYLDKDGNFVHGANTGVGGMVKRSAGYDPQHGDWEYFYFEDDGKIESGHIASCVQCHQAAKSKDYVFGTWKKTDNEVSDAATAIRKAVAAWEPIYGKGTIAAEKPYQALLINGIWIVTGSLPKDVAGGVALAEISKDDGMVLRVSHGQ